MIDLRQKWFSNSLVNIMGGLAAAGVNVLLIAILAHRLSPESFSIWNLSLQMMVYINILTIGLQTATARCVADANQVDEMRLPVIVHAARSIARLASCVAVLAVLLLVVLYPIMFPSIPVEMVDDFRIVLTLFGLASVTQIMSQVEMGVFQGLHRNAVFVGVQILVRILTVLAVWIAVELKQSIIVLAASMAAATASLFPAIRMVFMRALPWSSCVAQVVLDLCCRRELLSYCGSLSVWSVCMLLVNSVGIILVGRWDYNMTGAYAIAMTGATVLAGLVGAVMSPLLTTTAALYSNKKTRLQLPALLIHSTLSVSVSLNLLALFVVVTHAWIVRLWVGESFVMSAGPLLIILVGAHCLRNIGAPYALMLLATGLHKRALVSAVFEGFATLVASIIFGSQWGAMGVAFGSLVGSVIGIVGVFAMNAHRTPELTPQPKRIAFGSALLPTLIFSPLHYAALTKIMI